LGIGWDFTHYPDGFNQVELSLDGQKIGNLTFYLDIDESGESYIQNLVILNNENEPFQITPEGVRVFRSNESRSTAFPSGVIEHYQLTTLEGFQILLHEMGHIDYFDRLKLVSAEDFVDELFKLLAFNRKVTELIVTKDSGPDSARFEVEKYLQKAYRHFSNPSEDYVDFVVRLIRAYRADSNIILLRHEANATRYEKLRTIELLRHIGLDQESTIKSVNYTAESRYMRYVKGLEEVGLVHINKVSEC